MNCTCPDCTGTGKCGKCRGSGFVEKERPIVNQTVVCHHCKGKRANVCPTCGGDGTVLQRKPLEKTLRKSCCVCGKAFRPVMGYRICYKCERPVCRLCQPKINSMCPSCQKRI